MQASALLKESLEQFLAHNQWEWPKKTVIEATKDPRHGDLATNLPMVLTQQAKLPPRELATQLAQYLVQKHGDTLVAEVAGPGFLNITFAPFFWQQLVCQVEKLGKNFGSSNCGKGKKAQVEYVSANPTGPLHIGHGRGAAVGDSLARILRFASYEVTTEYYINDAGRQMRLLGLSVYLRLRECAGLPVTFPEDYYRGDYISDIAKELLEKQPQLATIDPTEAEEICFAYGMQFILDGIKEDLRIFRVDHQVWFSEKSLVEDGSVERNLKSLLDRGLAYEKDGALWFATTPFGDDRDRVLRKSDGLLTYFASDIAYHANKLQRGFDTLIDIWGADHHGYIPRMQAAISALGKDPQEHFAVVLIQLVNLLRGGQQVAMSTRSGEFVTLSDVVKEVGVDAARFMFLYRKSDSPLDFDLDLVKQRNMENPVYYVQYAHARIAALLRRASERGIILAECSASSDLAALHGPDEIALLRALDLFDEIITMAAQAKAPHTVSHYLMDLAGKLHSYYANAPVLSLEDQKLMLARLALLRAVGQVLKTGLDLLGVDAPESM